MGDNPRGRYYTSGCLASLPGVLLAFGCVWQRAVRLPFNKYCGSGLLTDRLSGLLPDDSEAKTRHLGDFARESNQLFSYRASLLFGLQAFLGVRKLDIWRPCNKDYGSWLPRHGS